MYPPSIQWRHSYFHPCWPLIFSLLPGKMHSSCVSPQVFLFLFCRLHKILPKPGDFVGSSHIYFPSSSLHPYGLGPCVLSPTGFLVVSIFLVFEALQGSWDVLFDPLYTIADFHLGHVELVECQDVGVGFDFFFSFSNNYSFNVVVGIPEKTGLPTSLLLPMSTPYSYNSLGSVEVFSLSCG